MGCTRNRKTEEKFIQNRKTANKIGQNRKPHTKLSDTMATREAYRANYTNTNFIKVFVNDRDFPEAFVNMFSHLLKSQALFLPCRSLEPRLIYRKTGSFSETQLVMEPSEHIRIRIKVLSRTAILQAKKAMVLEISIENR